MKLGMIFAAAAATACLWSVPAIGQDAPQHIVSLYRAAPGQQVALLKWMARQDQAAQAAGLPASQIYVHTSGDSWDYMVINPVTTKAQDDAVDAARWAWHQGRGPASSFER
jgi:hypothetical protein